MSFSSYTDKMTRFTTVSRGLLWGPGLSPCTHVKAGILILTSYPWSLASFPAHQGPSLLCSNGGPVSLQGIHSTHSHLPGTPGYYVLRPLWVPGISCYCSSPPHTHPGAHLRSSSTVCNPGLYHSGPCKLLPQGCCLQPFPAQAYCS